METAVHQTLINDLENLLASNAGIDEAKAKKLKKAAETLLQEQAEHALTQTLSETLTNFRSRINAQVEARDKSFEQVTTELTKAIQAIKDEKLEIAETATQKALSIAGQIPGLSEKRRAQIDTQLDKIYPKMRKLSAWRHWGTTHARENLIAQIKLLVDTRLEPNKIAKTLRDAKTQWQEWEKSGDHSEHKLWKEFSAACDLAYAPCKVLFKEQKAERKENLAQKRQLVAEINTRYEDTDWNRAEWKEIDKWLRQARGRYFKIGHIDYKHHKKLKQQLEKACEQFEDHLARERARSLKVRQNLIEEVRALEQLEDAQDAMRQLTQLKKKWVITVLEKRGIENKLWDQFQKAQDAIFTKRKAANKEQDQQRKDNLKQKQLIIESLIQATGETDEAVLAGQSALAQHKQQFNEIGGVPRNAEKGLMDRWRKAQKAFQDTLNKAQKKRAGHAQKTFIDKAKLCAAIEQQHQLGEAVDIKAANDAYAALPVLSKELEPQMQARLKRALDGNDDLCKNNTEAQLARCLKLEVMLDLATPAEYTQAKMAFQIERLSASMKKQNAALDDADTLKKQLLTTGVVHHEVFEKVWARIDTIFTL